MKKDNVYGSFGILTKDEMLEVKRILKLKSEFLKRYHSKKIEFL